MAITNTHLVTKFNFSLSDQNSKEVYKYISPHILLIAYRGNLFFNEFLKNKDNDVFICSLDHFNFEDFNVFLSKKINSLKKKYGHIK